MKSAAVAEQTGDGWNYTGVGFICVCAQVKRCWPFVLVVSVELAGVGGLALLMLDVAPAKTASCAVLRPKICEITPLLIGAWYPR